MTTRIETPTGTDELTEFVRFHDRVYAGRGAHWPAFVPLELPILAGESPFCERRRVRPFVARENGTVVARGLAVIDERYWQHWNDRIGHVVMFEALPGTRAAVRALMDTACEWLAGEGAIAARAGFGMMDMPFVIDDYGALPPMILRHNPAYYHALLKDAGFESEQGFVDYRIAVTPELVARWESALEGARRAGYRLVPLREIAEADRPGLTADLFNDTFKAHWGITPATAAEQALLFRLFEPMGFLDTCVIAYRGDDPVGQVTVVPEGTATAAVASGRTLADTEKLNWLGIGVREAARGRGVNLAMAAYAYLELVRRGATHVSYTLVLDDNWPSRRTAEKLGAEVCASFLAYRRELKR
ncbi:MAG: GNAT family N-acetyltransferase [Candidatus Binatia bacterium]